MLALSHLQTFTSTSLREAGYAVDATEQYIAVGAPGTNFGVFSQPGRVAVYNQTSGQLLHTLQNPDPRDGARFGSSVGVAGDYLVTSSPFDTVSNTFGVGSAHLFSPATGTLLATLTNPNPSADDHFGESVAIADGMIAVGAPREANQGKVYLFNYSGSLVRTINHPSPLTGFQSRFGMAVQLVDGKLFVSADSSNATPAGSGSVYIFNATTGGLLQTINNPSPGVGDAFGKSIDAVGNRLIIGAPGDDTAGTDSGSAYLYDPDTATLLRTLASPFAANSDAFGSSVGIFGNELLIGAPQADASFSNSGTVLSFDASTGALVGVIDNPGPGVNERFGFSIASSGTRVLVGANGDQNGRGAAHLYSSGPPPFSIVRSTNSVNENNVVGATVLTLSANPSTSGPFTFAFASGTGGEDNSAFSLVGNQLRAAQSFDFEIKSSYQVKIRATDSSGRFVTEAFTVSINDVNEGPIKVVASTTKFAELNEIGATVATLSTEDRDLNDAFTYTLVAGEGDASNSLFTITGDGLVAATTFDFESKIHHSVRVRSQDAGGLATESVLKFSVVDVNPPARGDEPTFDLRNVVDLNNTTVSSTPTEAVTIGAVTYFVGDSPLHGSQLWRTDGTNDGTVMLTNMIEGTVSTAPRNLFVFNNRVLYVGNYSYIDPNAPPGGMAEIRSGLFSTDGTSQGSTLLTRLDPAFGFTTQPDVTVSQFTELSGKLFFVVRPTSGASEQLWTTDGTANATAMIKELPLSPSMFPSLGLEVPTAVLGNRFLFNVNVDTAQGTHSLWASDGTTAGTVLLRQAEMTMGFPSTVSFTGNVVTAGNKAFFVSQSATAGKELWTTDGTVAGTNMVRDIEPGSGDGGISSLVALGNHAYFTSETMSSGRQLWRSDGTLNGTTQVFQTDAGFTGSVLSDLAVFDGALYFAGNDMSDGPELWKSDGTEAGTQVLYSIPGSQSLFPAQFFPLGDRLGFHTSTFSSVGAQTWSTDGTTSGTQFVSTFIGSEHKRAGNRTFFSATSPTHGTELWVSDGTPAGTDMVKDLNPGNASGLNKILAVSTGGVVVQGTSQALGTELGFSDGTPLGTYLLDVARGTPPANIREFIQVGNLFYVATDTALYKTDGTSSGTTLLREFGMFNGPKYLTALGNDIFFTAEGSSSQGRELWKTDGTVAGTVIHKDIRAGSGDSNPEKLTVFNDSVFFVANDGINGRELWRSDNGDAKAVLHTQFVTGAADGDINVLQVHNGSLYVIANGQLQRLNVSTFVPLATSSAREFMPWDDVLYFSGYSPAHGHELWRTDGTVTGTYLFQDLLPGPESSYPGGGVVIDGAADPGGSESIDAKLVFRAASAPDVLQLWSTDGTTPGTVQLTDFDVTPGPFSTNASFTPIGLAQLGNSVFFEAFTPATGRELWVSDGTPSGTKQVADLRSGPAPTPFLDDSGSTTSQWYQQRITSITPFRDAVFFQAGDNTTGLELWFANTDSGHAGRAIDILPGPDSGRPSNFFVSGNQLFVTANTLDFGVSDEFSGTGELFRLNESPYVTGLTRTLASNQTLQLDLPGYDPDDDTLTFEVVEQPLHGSVTIVDGTLTYTPMAGYAGTDRITYRASDGLLFSNIGTLELAIVASPYVVTLDSASSTTSERNGVQVVTASLDRPAIQAFAVPALIEGDAATEHGNLRQRQFVFEAGSSTASLAVQLRDDNRYELVPDKLEVTLVGSANAALGAIRQHIVSIHDNDPMPTVSFIDPWRSVVESDATEGITIGLSAASDLPVTTTVSVSFLTSATRNVDYIAPLTFDVEFLPGQTRKTLPIRIVQDSLPESRELIRADIGAVSGGIRTTNLERDRYLLHIADDDTSVVSLVEASQWIKPDGTAITEGDTVTVTAVRSGDNLSLPLSAPFTIFSQGANQGSDFTFAGQPTFEFAAGQTTATKTFTILDDNVEEPFEAFSVVLAGGSYALGATSSSFVGISDNDIVTSSLSLSRSTVSERVIVGQEVMVTVTLSSASLTTVRVPIRVSSGSLPGYATMGSDFLFDTSDFVFAPGQTQLSRVLTIINDDLPESDEIVRFTLGDQLFEGPLWRNQQTKELTITDDDFRVTLSGPTTIREDAGQFTISVTKDTPSVSGLVNIDIFGTAKLTAPQADVLLTSLNPSNPHFFQLFFSAGETTKDLTFQVVDDSLIENTERLEISAFRSNSQAQATHRVYINDNDSLPTTSFGPTGGFALTGDVDSLAIPINLSSPLQQDTRVYFALSGTAQLGTHYDIANQVPGALAIDIPAGMTSGVIDIVLNSRDSLTRHLDLNVNLGHWQSGSLAGLSSSPEPIKKVILAPQQPVGGVCLPPSSQDVLTYSTGALALPSCIISSDSSGVASFGDLAGSDISAADIIAGSLAILNASQGLLSGSEVFIDSNFNGIRDYLDLNQNGQQDVGEPSEPVGTTQLDGQVSFFVPAELDVDGNGTIDADEGRIVVLGGIDTSTGLVWELPLAAPMGATGVTPLTTILESLARVHNFTLPAATDRLRASLGLDGYDFTSTTPLKEIEAGDRLAEQAYIQNVQVSTAAILVGRLFEGRQGNGFVNFANSTMTKIASLVAAPNSVMNLTDTAFVRSLLVTNNELLANPFSAQELNDYSGFIAGRLATLQTLSFTDFGSTREYLQELSRLKKVLHGQLAEDLRTVGEGTLSFATLAATYTGSSFENLVDAQLVGDVIPPTLTVNNPVVLEGDSGTTVLRFEVSLIGQHNSAVSVDYATLGLIENSSSYDSVSGTLNWAPGDTTIKLVDVVVHGDTVFEADELVILSLTNATAAVIGTPDGYGFILNDDSAAITSTNVSSPNAMLVRRSPDRIIVSQGIQDFVNGEFVRGTELAFAGTLNQSNTSTFELSTPLSGDVFTLTGGSGSDLLELQGGSFDRVVYGGLAGQPNQLSIHDDDESTDFNWQDYEAVDLDVNRLDGVQVRLDASVTALTLVDPDTTSAGVMRLFTPDGSRTPISFTAPATSLVVVTFNPDLNFVVASLDSGFTGAVNVVAGGVQLDSSSVTIGTSTGTRIGSFLSNDPLFTSGFDVSLVSGEGDNSNSLFIVDNNELLVVGNTTSLTQGDTTIRVRVANSAGEQLEQIVSLIVQSPPDTTAPTSSVQTLAANASSLSIPIVVTGADVPGPGEPSASGVKEYDLFVAVNSGAFSYFSTVPAENPSTVYTASSNQIYFFRSIARDHAGNVEVKAANYADVFTRTADLDKPITQVDSATATAAGLFALTASGADVGGSQLTSFEFFVAIDNAAPVSIGSVSAGTAISGTHQVTTTYQAIADGVLRNYRFFTRGRDSVNNVEDAPITGDVSASGSFAAPVSLQATGIDVQRGARQRSVITDVDLLFNNALGLNDLLQSGRIVVERFGLTATNVIPGTGVAVPISNLQINGSKIRILFGSPLANDGLYRVRVDVNGDGNFNGPGEAFEFHRLRGDANGDGIINSLDTAIVDSLFGRVGSGLDGDLNGDGIVNTTDKSLTLRTNVGRKLADPLLALLDD